MSYLPLLQQAANTQQSSGGMMEILISFVLPLVILFGVMYFFGMRPQKKQQQQHDALISSIEPGDSVLTSSGFYGVILDVMDEIVIVEFGSNKNCRIPMKKEAIVEVEKEKK